MTNATKTETTEDEAPASYDPLDHLSDWTEAALEVRAAQTGDQRVRDELARRAA